MKGFAEVDVFTTDEIDLWEKATALVARLPQPENIDLIRCHELARAVGEKLGLEVQDGHFGFTEHSWLWASPKRDKSELIWRLPNILDVYVPGELPQVQLIHTSSALPMPYRFGPPRTDIREECAGEVAMSTPDLKDLLHVGDIVRHLGTKRVGKVTGFAHDGTIDVMVDGTGPYKQSDFERLVPEKRSDICTCRTFSECTHK